MIRVSKEHTYKNESKETEVSKLYQTASLGQLGLSVTPLRKHA